IWCDDFREVGRPSRPRHADVFSELEVLIGGNPRCRREVLKGVRRVWDCEPPDRVLRDVRKNNELTRLERLLKIVRWLFLEQDLTYWAGSGRWMLRRGIEERYGSLP